MNELKLLNEQEVLGKQFKVYGTSDNPLFMAKDVAEWIEYSQRSDGSYRTTEMLATVDEDEKIKIHVTVNNISGGSDTWFLTEDGLYEVLMQSRKPIAKQFKKKVKEILKTIRKTGGYVNNAEKMVDIYFSDMPDEQKAVIQSLLAGIEEKQNRIKFLTADNQRMKPKEEFFDAVTDSKDAIEIGKVAKVLNYPGIGRNKLFEILRKESILMKNNIPYQKYIDAEYFRTIEQKYSVPNGDIRINIKTLVYQKGVDFIRKILETDYIG